MPLGNIERLEVVLLLLAAVMGLTMLARRLLVPYPILLVLGGLALALAPGLPTIPLPPDLVFLVFLPPILWAAAYFTSLRDFRQNLRPILLLAIGLVLTTTAIVAVVARAMLPGLAWPAAITLGAIVSPPDAVAATAIARRLGIPRRVITVLEGESLVNDATALVLYRVAVAVAAGGAFALQDAVLTFVLSALGGCAIGLAVAWVAERAIRLSDEVMTDIAITLLSPYAAWLLAERVHASAVLACVAGGMLMRQRFSTSTSPATRLQGRAVWELVVFVLNGLIFMMIGLQLRGLGTGLSPDQLRQVIFTGLAVSVTVVAVRLIWVPVATVVPRLVIPGLRERDPMPPKGPIS